MPSKIQLDENLWFLYVCLQKSDYKSIDFNAVGDCTQLRAPAARMRYTRLRRSIESGTLIGTHGTPFQGSVEKIAQTQKKRKTPIMDEEDEEDEDDVCPPRPRRGIQPVKESRQFTSSSPRVNTSEASDADGSWPFERQAKAKMMEAAAVDSEASATSLGKNSTLEPGLIGCAFASVNTGSPALGCLSNPEISSRRT